MGAGVLGLEKGLLAGSQQTAGLDPPPSLPPHSRDRMALSLKETLFSDESG